MTAPERRFNEAEVAAILERALERATARDDHGHPPLPAGGGLTLAQVQDIGREIGLAPETVAASALVVDDRAPRTTRHVLGVPLGVEHVVQLPRRLTDDEWERLVVDLREIFGARGVVRQEGGLRQWTNGNLQALVEPTEHGQRVRLRTFKGSAPGMLGLGVATLGAGSVGMTMLLVNGGNGAGELAALGTLLAAGATTLVATVASLFPWARRRREQMTQAAERIAATVARGGLEDGG